MINIRPYKHSDFEMIASWWTDANEQGPINGMMLENGTFVLEHNNIPALCLSVFLTQSPQINYIHGFIKNPKFNNVNLEEFGQQLWNFCFNYAKQNGAQQITCFSLVNKLSDKYVRFGMTNVANNLSSFMRVL